MPQKIYINKYSKHPLNDQTLRKIKTTFEDQFLYLGMSSSVNEVRNKVMEVGFDTLRRISERLSPVSMIINCREQQCLPFFFPADDMNEPGFVVTKKHERGVRLGKKNSGYSKELTDMFNNTGFIEDPAREEKFSDFGRMLIRETLIIDQVATEIQYNRKGEASAFWLVDGATIARCTEKGYQGDQKFVFVQEVLGQVLAAYTRDELIFDYMFKRADMKRRGYGYSILEQSLDLITTLILGIGYNRDLLSKEKIPKGFIALQGDADQETIEAIERYWYMAMSGAGARFAIPILPTGKEGVSMDFKSLGFSNREMEYRQLMLFFLMLFGAVFGIDLAELGIKTDNTQQVLGEQTSGRMEFSKDRALKALLSHVKSYCNKILNKFDDRYEVIFTGMNPEDLGVKYDVAKKAVESVRSINDVLEEFGLEKKEGEEYDVPLNPQLIQLRAQIQQNQQQQMPGEEDDSQEDFEDDEEYDYSGDDEEEDNDGGMEEENQQEKKQSNEEALEKSIAKAISKISKEYDVEGL